MASRNTNFQMPMLVTDQPALQSKKGNTVRKPRFHEDFDAPLFEDLLDASPTSTSTENSSRNSSPRPSFDDANRKLPSHGSLSMRKHRNMTSPVVQLQNEWTSEPRRRTSVHDKMRQLARRSMIIVRRPERIGDDELEVTQRSVTKGIKVNGGRYGGSEEHLQTIITISEVAKPT
ncbi:hypothetical protein PT974_08710 [Cladobotryum mycophilum]|uniref:Uncharacterized protein n=1 Tax=Cladobotryum mycophilum TaxID=491253 RepID=A0ABR0SE43_9HYPO